MIGPAKPTDVPFTAITRAHRPEKIGAARLVPPICCEPPLTITFAPEFGSASNATSATPRCVPDHSVCQLGFGSIVLSLPPEPLHTVSLLHAVVDALSVVPATATTYGEFAGLLAFVPPSPHSSAPESPVEIENVWPCATAVANNWSSAASEPSLCASVSHSPSDMLMIFAAFAVTAVLMFAVSAEFASVGSL